LTISSHIFLASPNNIRCVVAVEQLVLDPGIAGGQRALDEEDGLGALDIEDRQN
jgi:hypothetical protein